MIKILFGAPGSGKTYRVFERLSEDYENSILIVPEQETVNCERLALERLPAKAQLSFEVLNFSRLCNKYFREYGNLSYNYIGPGMKSLFMWRALRAVDPEEYPVLGNELALTPIMLSTVTELKNSGVSTKELREVAGKLESGSPLKSKLCDIADISETYDEFVKNGFDDVSNDLYKLCEIADKNKIFAGKKIYIDSFSSFTAPELAIIKRMFSQAAEVVITLCCESPKLNLICNEGIKDTIEKLKGIAGDTKKIEYDYLLENHRTESPELRALNASLWPTGAVSSVADSIPEDKRGDLHIISCKNAYSEADAVVGIIKQQVANGLRYRDIAVISRDISTRRGIIDAALENASIPYFTSTRSDVAAKPVIRLVTSALKAKIYGLRTEDVLTNLNTGLYSIDRRDADFFADYVTTWSISGNKFLDEEPWTMNPDGYKSWMSDRARTVLDSANKVKTELIGTLKKFFIELEAAENARGLCRAVYGYFESISLAEKLQKLSDDEDKRGHRREAIDLLAVWNLMMSVLDDIVSALGDEKLTTDEFLRVFALVIDSSDIGAIPTKYDEVTLGSASLLRAGNVKCAIIVGLNDGEFPANVRNSGLFSSTDKATLVEYNIPLAFDQKKRNSEEFLYARRAISAPSESLYMLYCESTVTGSVMSPSLLVGRTKNLLPYVKIEKYEELDPEISLGSYSAAVNLLPEIKNEKKAEALRELLIKKGKISADRRIVDPECKIDKKTAEEFFGKEMMLSQTTIENYVNCGFKYCCETMLGLHPSKKAEISTDISGTFIHSLLEEILKRAVSKKITDIDLSFEDEAFERQANELVDELIDKICPPDKKESARISHAFDKLKSNFVLVIKNLQNEFAHSSFTPTYFELSIGNKPYDVIKPFEFKLNDDTKVMLNGKIDRVDVMKRKKEGTDVEDIYIRVVDYKTGFKEFSISDIRKGENLQLLIYIFTLCRENSDFSAMVGCATDKKPIPAATHYLSSKIKPQNLNLPKSDDELTADAIDGIQRSGLYLNDPEILAALNSDLDPKMLGGIEKINDKTFKGKGLATESEFEDILNELKSAVKQIATELRDGNLCAKARDPGDKPFCNFCGMKAICRSAQKTYH